MKIAIIGLGRMGSALLKGIMNAGIAKAEDIIASDPLLTEEESNLDFYGIRTTRDNLLAIRTADLVSSETSSFLPGSQLCREIRIS